jgi:hypothetical protein
MPRNSMTYPWRLSQEYVSDRKIMQSYNVDDGILQFSSASGDIQDNDEQLEAAE